MTDSCAVLVFDGFDELDAIGPYEVLANAAEFGADCSVDLVAPTTETVTAGHGLRVEPDAVLPGLDDIPPTTVPDLLVVAGGGWSDGGGVHREVADGVLPDAIARLADAGTTVASVCTGAMLLAAAGILDDRPATTHAVAREDLAETADLVDARVVDCGDVLSAGGVTAGLDLAFHLVEREFGPDVAAQVSEEMEYESRGEVHVVST